MAKKTKRITYRNKKTGEIKYYYYEISGKTTKRVSAREFYKERGGVERKTLSKAEAIDYLKSKSATFKQISVIMNDLEGSESENVAPKTFTKAGLDKRLNEEKLSRNENFLRQLGYSLEEFEDEFGITRQYVNDHDFEDIGDGVFKLSGTNLLFIWDYDTGLRSK